MRQDAAGEDQKSPRRFSPAAHQRLQFSIRTFLLACVVVALIVAEPHSISFIALLGFGLLISGLCFLEIASKGGQIKSGAMPLFPRTIELALGGLAGGLLGAGCGLGIGIVIPASIGGDEILPYVRTGTWLGISVGLLWPRVAIYVLTAMPKGL